MKQTFDLNYLLEQELKHDDQVIKGMTFKEKVDKLREIIFDFDYPIDEQYRDNFETAFISKFFFKEIGFGTYTRWHYEVQAHLNIHGTRYNNLYKAEMNDIEKAINTINIENTSDSESIQDAKSSGKADNSSTGTSYNENRASDTPQGRLEIDGNYVSGLSDAKQKSENTGESVEESAQSSNAKATGKTTTKGYSGLTLTQLNRIFAEQMVIANELVLYNFEVLFLQIVL